VSHTLLPDRLLPVDPGERALARELFALVADAPIVSPHGHVDPRLLLEDEAFPDPTMLLVQSDHYVTRLLHAAGLPYERLRTDEPRAVWREFCARWGWLAGTASGLWLREILATVFEERERPSAENADDLYDRLCERLAEPGMRPRALFDAFGLRVLATTDDPMTDLTAHDAVNDAGLGGRLVPTFRPDAYLDPDAPGWVERIDRLGGDGHSGYIAALRSRRAYFVAHGAVSVDMGTSDAHTAELTPNEAATLFDRLRNGRGDAGDAATFRAHMLFEMARMSVDDGLVLTLHAGVLRNHHTRTLTRFGPDTGHDLPLPVDFTRGLRPLLERFGTEPALHLILFTLDESAWSRDLAPLAGFYPSVFIGAPWWFLDAPDAMLRFRAAVTETAGFYRGSGFIDDTRAFLSIPARHAVSRRIDSAYLARLVVQGRIDDEEAVVIARDLVDAIPRTAFRL
jgi:glucuronate isomerase